MLYDDFRFFLTTNRTNNIIKRATIAADEMMIGWSQSLRLPVEQSETLKKVQTTPPISGHQTAVPAISPLQRYIFNLP